MDNIFYYHNEQSFFSAKKHSLFGVAFKILLIIYFIMSIMAFTQVRRTRRLYRDTLPEKKDWYTDNLYFFTGKPGRVYPIYPMVGREKEGANAGKNPTIQVRLPPRKTGYVVNFGFVYKRLKNPPIIHLYANKAFAGTVKPIKSKETVTAEIEIPSSLLMWNYPNYLKIENDSTGGWIGSILLIPYAPFHKVLRVGLPLMFLLITLFFYFQENGIWRILQYPLFLLLVFPLYFYTLMTWKMGPLNGFIFSDCEDIATAILTNSMTFDMQKHLLFLPFMRVLYLCFHKIGQPELVALTSAFASVGALNCIIAYLLFQILFKDKFLTLFSFLLYVISFSIWAYSSVFETFIFSSLITNVFLVTLLFVKENRKPFIHLILWACIAVSGLFHPPMLALYGLYIARLVLLDIHFRKKILYGIAGLCLVLMSYFMATIFLNNVYAVATPDQIVKFYNNVINNYASMANFSWTNICNVLLDQFYYAFVGRPAGWEWGKGLYGVVKWRGYLIESIAGLMFFAYLAYGMWGIVSKRILGRFCFLCLFLMVIPYLCFYVYFNPLEMILYTPPLISLIIGGASRGVQILSRKGGVTDALLVILVMIVLIANTISILSYT